MEGGAEFIRYPGEPGEGDGRRAGQGGIGGGSRTLVCREEEGRQDIEM